MFRRQCLCVGVDLNRLAEGGRCACTSGRKLGKGVHRVAQGQWLMGPGRMMSWKVGDGTREHDAARRMETPVPLTSDGHSYAGREKEYISKVGAQQAKEELLWLLQQ